MPLTAVLLLCGAFLVVGLRVASTTALSDRDEFHTAERTRQMLVSSDYLEVKRNCEMDGRKPPLHYWLSAVTWDFLGNPRLAVAFWSSIYGAGCLLLLYFWIRSLWPGWPWMGFVAALFLAASPYFFQYAAAGYLDTGMTFYLLLTALGYELARKRERYWWLVSAGIILGSLEKLPLGLLYFLLAWLVDRMAGRKLPWVNRDFRRSMVAALLVLILWPLSQVIMCGPVFLSRFYGQQIIERMITDRYNADEETLGMMVSTWKAWPGVLLCAAGGFVWLFWSRAKGREEGRHLLPALYFAAGIVLVFVCRLYDERYFIPLFPVVALSAAYAVHALAKGKWPWMFGVCGLVMALTVPISWKFMNAYIEDTQRREKPYTVVEDLVLHMPVEEVGQKEVVFLYVKRPPLNFISAFAYLGDFRRPVISITPRDKVPELEDPPVLEVGQEILLVVQARENGLVKELFPGAVLVYENDLLALWKVAMTDPGQFRRRVL